MTLTSKWSGIHVFLHTTEDILPALDTVRACLPPPVADWFFILYGERGYHLRIRLGEDARDHVDQVRLALSRWMVARSAEVDIQSGRPAMPHWAGEDRISPGSIVDVAYIPETLRYGGIDALDVNERLFRISSRLAHAAWSGSVENEGLPAKVAIDMMLAAVSAICTETEDAAAFFEEYTAFWRAYLGLPEETAKMTKGAAIRTRFRQHLATESYPSNEHAPSALWRRAIADANASFVELGQAGRLISPRSGRRADEAPDIRLTVRDMLVSQIHMNSNRLGCSPLQEYRWAAEISAAMRG